MLKPKWNSQKSHSLPLYYKDKRVGTDNVSGWVKSRFSRHRKMLLKAFIVSAVLYTILWVYSLLPARGGSKDRYVSLWDRRKNEVRTAFLNSWNDYSRHGWGKDIYRPVSQQGRNMGPSPLGWIIVDSLDTLQLMGCKDEFREARSWVKYELDYNKFDHDVNTFETTIRMLGGLLSAYYLTEDELFLERATGLANKLSGAFNTKTGIPYSSINLHTGKGIPSREGASTAEVATLQLEFKYLAHLTGEKMYWDQAEKAMKALDQNQPEGGLVPIFVDPESGHYKGEYIRLGSRGDSYYEYLLKQYYQTGEKIYLRMYLESFEGIKKYLINKSQPNGLTFIGERPTGLNGPLSNKMDHLVCFIGSVFALGATGGSTVTEMLNNAAKTWTADRGEQLQLAKEIGRTCYMMYHEVDATGLAPEIVVFNTDSKSSNDFSIKRNDKHNLQRPETIETLYYLYRITGDVKYREWGYEIFRNFLKYTRVPSGRGQDDFARYSSLSDVTMKPPRLRDNMESFWLAETLKYLYLLFDDDIDPKWDLKNVVYNTEAHPFPRFSIAGTQFSTGWRRVEKEKKPADEVHLNKVENGGLLKSEVTEKRTGDEVAAKDKDSKAGADSERASDSMRMISSFKSSADSKNSEKAATNGDVKESVKGTTKDTTKKSAKDSAKKPAEKAAKGEDLAAKAGLEVVDASETLEDSPEKGEKQSAKSSGRKFVKYTGEEISDKGQMPAPGMGGADESDKADGAKAPAGQVKKAGAESVLTPQKSTGESSGKAASEAKEDAADATITHEEITENVEKNKEVAEKMKEENVIPQAKHEVAEPLDAQIQEVNEEAAKIPVKKGAKKDA